MAKKRGVACGEVRFTASFVICSSGGLRTYQELINAIPRKIAEHRSIVFALVLKNLEDEGLFPLL